MSGDGLLPDTIQDEDYMEWEDYILHRSLERWINSVFIYNFLMRYV